MDSIFKHCGRAGAFKEEQLKGSSDRLRLLGCLLQPVRDFICMCVFVLHSSVLSVIVTHHDPPKVKGKRSFGSTDVQTCPV